MCRVLGPAGIACRSARNLKRRDTLILSPLDRSAGVHHTIAAPEVAGSKRKGHELAQADTGGSNTIILPSDLDVAFARGVSWRRFTPAVAALPTSHRNDAGHTTLAIAARTHRLFLSSSTSAARIADVSMTIFTEY